MSLTSFAMTIELRNIMFHVKSALEAVSKNEKSLILISFKCFGKYFASHYSFGMRNTVYKVIYAA